MYALLGTKATGEVGFFFAHEFQIILQNILNVLSCQLIHLEAKAEALMNQRLPQRQHLKLDIARLSCFVALKENVPAAMTNLRGH